MLNFGMKLSEKSRRYPKRGPTRHLNPPVRSVLAPIHGSNTHPERHSNPFSDSFITEFSEVHHVSEPSHLAYKLAHLA
jgi:hypothetical protein